MIHQQATNPKRLFNFLTAAVFGSMMSLMMQNTAFWNRNCNLVNNISFGTSVAETNFIVPDNHESNSNIKKTDNTVETTTIGQTVSRSLSGPLPNEVTVGTVSRDADAEDTTNDIAEFKGSTVESQTPGISVFTNVCWRWRTSDQHVGFSSYGPNKLETYIKQNKTKWEERIEQRPLNKIFHYPTNQPIEQWLVDKGNSSYIPGETLLTVDFFGNNPAHCLSDVIFSMTYQNNSSSPVELHFPSYTYSDYPKRAKWEKDCPESSSWCCHIMKRSGIIPKNTPPVHPDTGARNSNMMCFERLAMPHFMEYRLTPDPRSIQNLHKRVLDNGFLSSAAWKRNAAASQKGPTPILLYDRKGSRRRVYNNSDELVEYLESTYDTKIHQIGSEWNALEPAAQAALYNTYQNIIAPHGAHLGNLIYCKPNTRMIEIQCEVDKDAPIQKRSSRPLPFTPSDNSTRVLSLFNHAYDSSYFERRENDIQWYGTAAGTIGQDWFTSFSAYLDIEHFVFVEKAGCPTYFEGKTLRNKYSPPQFNIDPIELGEYVAQRFGLRSK